MTDDAPEFLVSFLVTFCRRLEARGGVYAEIASDLFETALDALSGDARPEGGSALVGGLEVEEDPDEGLVIRLPRK